MRFAQPITSIQADYGYCNSCFLTAGQIIPVVTGQQWENFVHDSIIAPLEMNSTMFFPVVLKSNQT
jgi:CubicO group peptidase (beta-lactamase class C family)